MTSRPGSAKGGVTLDIATPPATLDPRFPLSRRELLALMDTLLAVLGLSGRRLTLTLVDDAGVAALNEKFLGAMVFLGEAT